MQQAVGVTGATPGSGAGALNQSHLGRDDGETRYFSAVYCKSSARKHKKYEDDAMLIVRAKTRLAILKDAAGKKEIAVSPKAREDWARLEDRAREQRLANSLVHCGSFYWHDRGS